MSDTETVEIFCKILNETPDALLITIDDKTQSWVPLSQITEMERNFNTGGQHDTALFLIPEWMALEKGLI